MDIYCILCGERSIYKKINDNSKYLIAKRYSTSYKKLKENDYVILAELWDYGRYTCVSLMSHPSNAKMKYYAHIA